MPETLSVKLEGIPDLLKRLDVAKYKREIARGLLRGGTHLEAAIKRRTPVVTGRLRSSWTTRASASGLTVTVGTNVVYAPMVEYGTKAHDIYPKVKQALAWPIAGKSAAGLGRGPQGTLKGQGALIVRKYVHHPGTKGRHMAERAIQEESSTVVGMIRERLEALLAGR